MYQKISLAVFYIVIACLIYVYGEALLAWFGESDHAPMAAGLATLMALFPVIPYPVVGGVIGAAFGPVLGGFITWVGSAAASVLMFLFVRYGYQEWGARLLKRSGRLGKVTALFERNAFLAILFARLVPFVPSILINVYSALSRVSLLSYTVASSLGKIPAMLLFAFVGDNLMTEPRNVLITIGVYGVFLLITLGIHRLWKGKKSTQRNIGESAEVTLEKN
ncbi:TVP38/TMEM64 family protein [Paenibacillus lutrae]|uniref:TVP38/TMEM64 family membrane protein n=1 Tax=Paenibacillus lutrae TaxID=2078573 RepID=A0A7X3K043_9BACL|nr:TVP38/TMEM64 family protein [Paenibacillus lutrae]MVP00591.1 TVP38/TMEM64 family protein [Paenibacillus lutrae]